MKAENIFIVVLVVLLIGSLYFYNYGISPRNPEFLVMKTLPNPRITVTRVGIFNDELAYSNKRGIYIIKDTTTGKEYVGVSGIGISELGMHRTGKTQTQDER